MSTGSDVKKNGERIRGRKDKSLQAEMTNIITTSDLGRFFELGPRSRQIRN